MKTHSKVSLLVLLLASAAANAAPSDPLPNLTDVALTPDGRVMKLSRFSTRDYCGKQGLRIPTVTEWALHAQSLGAIEIRETAYPDISYLYLVVGDEVRAREKEGYRTIYGLSRALKIVVYFYYKPVEGYTPPDLLHGQVFWTSTYVPYDNSYAYLYDGSTGNFLMRLYPRELNAVRCVRDEPAAR